MITHIVSWIIKGSEDQSKEERLIKMKALLETLPSKVPEIVKYEVGIDFNRSDAAYDIVLYSTFESREALSAYQANPDHVVVLNYILSIMDKRVVVDYVN